MKLLNSCKIPRWILVFVVIVFTLVITLPAGASSSSIVRPYIGYTKIRLNYDFVNELIRVGAIPSAVKPAYLNLKKLYAVFPIVSGIFDKEWFDNEFNHAGGFIFQFDDVDGSARLLNFAITSLFDSVGGGLPVGPGGPLGPGGPPGPGGPSGLPIDEPEVPDTVITGIVVDNGTILFREAIFDLSFAKDDIKVKRNTLIIKNVTVSLNPMQAAGLNDLLGTDFSEIGSTEIGTAKVYARFYSHRKYRFWGYGDD